MKRPSTSIQPKAHNQKKCRNMAMERHSPLLKVASRPANMIISAISILMQRFRCILMRNSLRSLRTQQNIIIAKERQAIDMLSPMIVMYSRGNTFWKFYTYNFLKEIIYLNGKLSCNTLFWKRPLMSIRTAKFVKWSHWHRMIELSKKNKLN